VRPETVICGSRRSTSNFSLPKAGQRPGSTPQSMCR
jgi:hypothetical protein